MPRSNIASLVVGVILGMVVSFLFCSIWTADERKLAALFPTHVALHIKNDMRVMNLLEKKDAENAMSILRIYLKSDVTTLRVLTNYSQPGDTHIKALSDAINFLARTNKDLTPSPPTNNFTIPLANP